jgi:putative acetyltransferase
MIRKYTANETDALITIWENADSVAHPFLPKSVREKVREDMRNI